MFNERPHPVSEIRYSTIEKDSGFAHTRAHKEVAAGWDFDVFNSILFLILYYIFCQGNEYSRSACFSGLTFGRLSHIFSQELQTGLGGLRTHIYSQCVQKVWCGTLVYIVQVSLSCRVPMKWLLIINLWSSTQPFGRKWKETHTCMWMFINSMCFKICSSSRHKPESCSYPDNNSRLLTPGQQFNYMKSWPVINL